MTYTIPLRENWKDGSPGMRPYTLIAGFTIWLHIGVASIYCQETGFPMQPIFVFLSCVSCVPRVITYVERLSIFLYHQMIMIRAWEVEYWRHIYKNARVILYRSKSFPIDTPIKLDISSIHCSSTSLVPSIIKLPDQATFSP